MTQTDQDRTAMEHSATLAMQGTLAKLPVPRVEDTLQSLVDTCRPFLRDESQLAELERLARAAAADPELARRQEELLRLHRERRNWMSAFWVPGAYMQWRAALAINSNVAGYLYGENRKRWDQVFALAGVVRGALDYHVRLLDGRVPPNTSRGKPTCMDQYTRMFSHTRVPGVTQDSPVKYAEQESQHVVVVAAKHTYLLQVLRGREIIPMDLLYASLQAIRADAEQRGEARHPICALTATDRTRWALARGRLLGDVTNSAALDLVERAVFTASFEAGVEGSDGDCASSGMVGADGETTWFDKSFHLRAREDGNPSVCVEHSWAEAPVPLGMFFDQALPFAEALDEPSVVAAGQAAGRAPRPAAWPPHERLDWNFTDELVADIAAAKAEVAATIADSDTHIYRCFGVGKKVWKTARLSPDAVVQMAMQLAYRQATGAQAPVATYETIGLTNYVEGRTETCRVVSEASEAFVRAAQTFGRVRSETNRAAAEVALRRACDAHMAYLRKGQEGRGVDRHLFALRLLSPDGNQPAIFAHPSVRESGTFGEFVISSSNNSYIERPFGGIFGAVVPHGVGVCYIPRADEVVLCIETKHSTAPTSSLRFGAYVEQALHEIRRIAGTAPTSKQ